MKKKEKHVKGKIKKETNVKEEKEKYIFQYQQ